MPDHPRIEELRRRVLADPASIAFAALAEEFRRSGKYEEAIETCRTGLQRHPSYLSARVTLGRALMETAQYDLARKELELVLKSAPENLAAIRGLAEIHERLGDHADHEAFANAMPASEPLPTAAPPEPQAAEPAVEKPSPAEPVRAAAPVEPEPPKLVAVAAAPPAAPPAAAAPKIAIEPVKIAAAPIAVATAAPDPVVAGLERFLAAIQTARASAPNAR